MKIRTKFTVLGSLAVLSITPMTFAEDIAIEPQIAECWEGITEFIEEPAIIECESHYEIDQEVSIDPAIIDEEIFSTGVTTDEVIFENEVTSDEEVTYVDEEISDEEVIFVDEETSDEEVAFENEEISDEEITFDDNENIDEEVTTTDGQVTDGEIADGGGGVFVTWASHEESRDYAVNWLVNNLGASRDINFNLASAADPAGNPTSFFRNETSSPSAAASPIARQIGPDSKATAIEGRENSGAFKAHREKKRPVALVKEGRVFLR